MERVFSILLQKYKPEQVKANEVEVYVIAVGDGLMEDRMKVCAELWNAGIKVCSVITINLAPRNRSGV